MKRCYWYCFQLVFADTKKKQCKKTDKMPKSDTITESTKGERKNMKERLTLGGFELWSRWKCMEKYPTLQSVSILTTITLHILSFGRSPRPSWCIQTRLLLVLR